MWRDGLHVTLQNLRGFWDRRRADCSICGSYHAGLKVLESVVQTRVPLVRVDDFEGTVRDPLGRDERGRRERRPHLQGPLVGCGLVEQDARNDPPLERVPEGGDRVGLGGAEHGLVPRGKPLPRLVAVTWELRADLIHHPHELRVVVAAPRHGLPED